jgi:two-component system sensor histidine kinase PhoQ
MASLHARTLAGAAAILTVFMLLSALTLERAFEQSARTALQQRLLGQLYLLIGETDVSEQGSIRLPPASILDLLNQPDSGLYARLQHNGRSVWQSRSVIKTNLPFSEALPAGEQLFSRIDIAADESYFVLGFGIEWLAADNTVPLSYSIMENTINYDAQVADYRTTLWGWLAALSGGLLVALVMVLRWGLKPLDQVATDLGKIEQGQVERLEGLYPKELNGLTNNLNALLDHERSQQSRYRNALGDLAHSLKTPLAVLRGAGHDSQDKQQLADTLEEQVARMDSIVSRELQRAATRGRIALATPVPLAEHIRRLGKALGKVYRNKHVTFMCNIDDDLQLRMDEGDCTELFGNLLDNAFKFCNRAVIINADISESECLLTISDDGPGFDEETALDLLARGARLDESVPGQGIGLAVAYDIIAAYDGTLSLSRNLDGGGLVSIHLPAN